MDTRIEVGTDSIAKSPLGKMWAYVLGEACTKEDHDCPLFQVSPKSTMFVVSGYTVPILPCPLCSYFKGVDWPKVVKAEELDRKLGKGEKIENGPPI
jgi:hypothetical protein